MVFINFYTADNGMTSTEQFKDCDFDTIEAAIEYYMKKHELKSFDHFEMLDAETLKTVAEA